MKEVKCDGCPLLYLSEEFDDPHCTIADFIRETNNYRKHVPYLNCDGEEHNRTNIWSEACPLVLVRYRDADGIEREFKPEVIDD